VRFISHCRVELFVSQKTNHYTEQSLLNYALGNRQSKGQCPTLPRIAGLGPADPTITQGLAGCDHRCRSYQIARIKPRQSNRVQFNLYKSGVGGIRWVYRANPTQVRARWGPRQKCNEYPSPSFKSKCQRKFEFDSDKVQTRSGLIRFHMLKRV